MLSEQFYTTVMLSIKNDGWTNVWMFVSFRKQCHIVMDKYSQKQDVFTVIGQHGCT